MKTALSILSFFLFYHFCSAQNLAKIDSLKKLGRDSLIKLAIKKVNDPAFDPKAYDRIIVKADSSKLVVEFELSEMGRAYCREIV